MIVLLMALFGCPLPGDDSGSDSGPICTAEICDGLDNNCDSEIDEGVQVIGFTDADGDGYGYGAPIVGCSGLVDVGGDCDDGDATMHPGAAEEINGVDNDCDGFADGDGTFCGTLLDPSPSPNGCIDQEIFDGDVITGTTTGGGNNTDTQDYESWSCPSLSPDGYDSQDRAYLINIEAFFICTVYLTKECGNELELFAIKSDNGDSCPLNTSLPACGHWSPPDFFGDEDIDIGAGVVPSNDGWWAIIVDSRSDTEVNFTLRVHCR